MELAPPALEAQSLKHWTTREVLIITNSDSVSTVPETGHKSLRDWLKFTTNGRELGKFVGFLQDRPWLQPRKEASNEPLTLVFQGLSLNKWFASFYSFDSSFESDPENKHHQDQTYGHVISLIFYFRKKGILG